MVMPAASLTLQANYRSMQPIRGSEDPPRRKPMRKIATILAGIAAVVILTASASAQTVLKASHQFPGGKGDPRDEMVQIIARAAQSAAVSPNIQVYPGASLLKPNRQWNAMVNG